MKKKHYIQKLGNCICYDLREGVLGMFPLYILAGCFMAFFAYDAGLRLERTVGNPSALDLAVYVFQGMGEYIYVKGGPQFEIPIAYLVIALLSGLFACYYSRREWNMRGNTYIPRYGTKGIWWFSKCIWCMMQMIVLYGIFFLIFWIMAAVGGNPTLTLSSGIAASLDGMPLTYDTASFLLYIYVLGPVTAIALNQLLVTLQMLFHPVAGYTLVMGILTASAYFFRGYLVGNNQMLLWTVLFRPDGIRFSRGLFYALMIWLLCVLAGRWIISKKDIL